MSSARHFGTPAIDHDCNHDRRRVLLTASVAAGATAMIASGCGPGPSACPNTTGTAAPTDSALTVAEVPVGAAVCSTAGSFVVARDADGIYAYTTICPHQGCIITCPTSSTATVTCLCHNSTFNGNGDRLSGPTPTGLEHFAVSLQGTGPSARIFVDPCTIMRDTTVRVLPS